MLNKASGQWAEKEVKKSMSQGDDVWCGEKGRWGDGFGEGVRFSNRVVGEALNI